jgi:hypothetical protein
MNSLHQPQSSPGHGPKQESSPQFFGEAKKAVFAKSRIERLSPRRIRANGGSKRILYAC